MVTQPSELSLILIKLDKTGANCANSSEAANNTIVFDNGIHEIKYFDEGLVIFHEIFLIIFYLFKYYESGNDTEEIKFIVKNGKDQKL